MPALFYKGEHNDLFTVAINSVLGISGFNVHFGSGPQIEVMEEDYYGRKLFLYFEGSEKIKCLVISQKSDDSHVYYYEDYNFIAKCENSKKAQNDFSEAQIEELKNLNDWNNPLNEDKFIKEKIVSKKTFTNKFNIENGETIKKLYGEIIGTSDNYSGTVYLTSDNDGRMIFCVQSNYNKNYDNYSPYVVIIVNSDWTYKDEVYGMLLNNLYNYQDDLKSLKESNDWNR